MKMRLAALALLASALPAYAQTASFYLLKDAASPQSTFQMGLYTTAGKSAPVSVSSDSAGRTLAGVAGTTNPNGTALFVQGVTGGVPLPITFAAPQHVICDSGCTGGGGGLSVPFAGAIGANGTPGGFKDGTGNFQPLLGDVTNGQWVAIKSSVALGVTGTFWQATQPVSATSLPLPAGAATSALQSTINTTLGTPFQAGGSIGNTSFGISGTLPAFAATPTVNLGTIGGAATQTTLASVLAALGSPFQAGGSIGNTSFAATQATAASLNATVVGTGAFAVQLSGATNNINNISGTISLPTGAATSANQILTQAPIAPNTATATKSDLIGGQFDTTQKTLTNGQQAAYSMSARGALFVAVGADGFAVTNGGTFAVQAAQSGTWNIGSITTLPALVAGSAIIGKVGIDQTTPGTTNGVQVNSSALPTGAATSANQVASGSVTSTSVSVTNSSTSLASVSAFSNFGKVCVPITAANGIWVRWDGVAATTAPPAEYMPPGQCDSWSKLSGYLPTQAWNAISASASTIAVSVAGN